MKDKNKNKKIGRPSGSKDKGKRNKLGYGDRWQKIEMDKAMCENLILKEFVAYPKVFNLIGWTPKQKTDCLNESVKVLQELKTQHPDFDKSELLKLRKDKIKNWRKNFVV